MASIVAVGSGAWILVGVSVALVIAVAIGLYDRRGTGIAQHPRGSERDDTAGSDRE